MACCEVPAGSSRSDAELDEGLFGIPKPCGTEHTPRLWASRAGLWFTGSGCSRSDTGRGCRLGCGMKSCSDLFLVLEEKKLCAYIITLHVLIQPGLVTGT